MQKTSIHPKTQRHSRFSFPTSAFLLIFFLIAITVSPVQGQWRTGLLDTKTRDLLHEALSGERAKDHVIQITRHHRIQGSRGYRHAANYVVEQLRKAGFPEKDAYIESFKSDGKVQYQTWQSPSGWDIESAELRMIEPFEKRIAGYPEIAMSVITYSNPGEVTAELVWVGSGTRDADYEGKDVQGKIVLATGYGGAVHRLAVLKYGAKAVVCYLADDRAKDFPDMLAYTGMWPRSEELDRVTFGFNLTNRQGEELRQLLESGKKVVLDAKVEGIGLEPYEMDVVVAHIRGAEKPEEELVFSAHLDHPKESANDNASGSAALLDIASTVKKLIDNGRLAQPKRSLRFLWVPEWYGTMAYIDKHPEMVGPDLGGTFLANLNMDMVGENLELLHTKLILTRTPDSMPSIVNDVVENMAEMVDRMEIRTPRGSRSVFNYRMTPYSGGSDHMMFIDRKIPGVMFSHSPDYTHHTSEDTPDKVDPVELERCEIIAAATALYLANLDERQATDLTYLAYENAAHRQAEAFRQAKHLLAKPTNGAMPAVYTEMHNLLVHAKKREQNVLNSILHFQSSENVAFHVKSHQYLLDQQSAEFENLLLESAKKADHPIDIPLTLTSASDNRVPMRTTRGPLDFGLPISKLSGADAAWYASSQFTLNGNQRFELVNFVDGKRTVSDIRNALSAEYRPLALAVVSRYLNDLMKVGAIKWKE